MLVQTLILLIAICSLIEIRRQNRQISTRFIERGKQKIADSLEAAKENENSLQGALHCSRVAFWIIVVLSAVDLIHRLLTHE
jgi:hypothetical protein